MFTFELTGDCGAALVTRYPTHREDSAGASERVFEQYVKSHYESWVEFACDKNLQDVQPVLISGFDVTKDFAMVSYLNHPDGPPLGIGYTISRPMFASTTPLFGGSWRFKYTPHFQEAESVSIEFDQCVFIRYYTMRFKRLLGLLKTSKPIRAGTRPHDLSSGGKQENTFPEPTVQFNNAPLASGSGEPGGQPGSIAESAGSEPDTIIQNTLCVRFLLCLLFFL